MLDGACRGLPAILSRENLTRFEDHLFRILKTVNTVEDQSLSLLCLGIMTKMACATTSRASIARARSSDDLDDLSPQSSNPPSPSWRSEAAQQFFTGAKAPKTMQLIVLRVIWACKGNVGIQHSEAYTSVRLGNEILKAVDTDLRNDWIRRNTPIVRKLHEKVLTSDARPELQLEPRFDEVSWKVLLHHYLRITVEPWSQPSLAMRGLRLSILELVTLAREFSSAALSAQSDEVGITTAVANALLDKQAAFAAAISRCQSLRSTSLNVPTIAKPLPNEKVMQQEQHYGRDWRQQLAADLRREARDREGTIIQTVGRICHDLEERCEKAEEPLREEQAKVRSLQERHDQLSLVVSKLETEAMDRSLYVDAIEVENTRQERDLQQSALKMTETLRKVGDLQGQLRETNASHERSLAELRYTNESRELEFAATLATKTDHISDQEEKVRDMEQSLRKLKDDLEETDRDRSRLKDSNTNLRNTVESMQQELESRRLSSTELQSDIERLTKAEEGLTSQMRGLQNSLQEKHVELERMQSEIHNLRGSSESAIEALKAQHLSELDGIVDTNTTIKTELEEKLQQMNSSIQELRQTSSETIQQKDARILELERKVKRANKACHNKDKELEEAQELKARLMAAMGLAGGHPNLFTKVPVLQRPTRNLSRTPAVHEDNEENEGMPTASQYEDMDLSGYYEGSGSHSIRPSTSSRNEPTPKRAKPCRSFRVPAMQQSRLSTGPRQTVPSHVTRSVSKRTPLKDVDANQSPLRRQHISASQANHKERIDSVAEQVGTADREAMEDMSFNESGLFTSTPATPRPAQLREAQDIYDETTTADV
ncbi:hypothetical protein LTR04_004940 [Oleoguttula sp. CCFEE 6159]|nr:hypothetical protein LTR04_004940 [Oleoguttula sp. CCFEE 6159]